MCKGTPHSYTQYVYGSLLKLHLKFQVAHVNGKHSDYYSRRFRFSVIIQSGSQLLTAHLGHFKVKYKMSIFFLACYLTPYSRTLHLYDGGQLIMGGGNRLQTGKPPTFGELY